MRRFGILVSSLLILGTPSAFANGHSRWSGDTSFSFDNGEATDCSAIHARIDGETAKVVSEDIAAGGLRSLRVHSYQRGGIRIVGTSDSAFSITACKISALDANASDVRVTLSGNDLSVSGPDSDKWMAYLIVRAPRAATVEADAKNGPITVSAFDGQLTVTAHNGPVSLRESRGTIEANVQNGPISLSGGSGSVKLTAQNGPIAVKLTGSEWSGSLEASAQNGPVALKLPRNFRSGVVVEALGHGPVVCRAEGCEKTRLAPMDASPRRIELGSGPRSVHLSTVNGPVSVKNND
jgi:hypothetical protein